jgi:hypothetical protein
VVVGVDGDCGVVVFVVFEDVVIVAGFVVVDGRGGEVASDVVGGGIGGCGGRRLSLVLSVVRRR